MKVKVIHGAPCSGKTTYVKKHIKANDIAYDYDQLSRALQYSGDHKANNEVTHDFVIDFRLAIINRIKYEKERKGNCYFIVTFLTDSFKEYIKDCDVEYIKMEATKEECLERLEKDDERKDKDGWKKKINEWFDKYEGKNMEEKSLKPNREYRSLTLEARATEKEKYIVEGYASTFNDEYVLYEDGDLTISERISPLAFNNCDMKDVIFQYDHQGRVFARTRNKTLELSIDEKGLFIRADLGGTEEGRKLYEEIKGGYTDKMSFSFIVKADERTTVEDIENNKKKCVRTITDISKLYDVSAVSIPANDYTSISARNLCNGVIEQIALERKERTKNILKLKLKLGE
jgi:HK97 family phage prohead protease